MVYRLLFPGRHLGGAKLFLALSSQDHCYLAVLHKMSPQVRAYQGSTSA